MRLESNHTAKTLKEVRQWIGEFRTASGEKSRPRLTYVSGVD